MLISMLVLWQLTNTWSSSCLCCCVMTAAWHSRGSDKGVLWAGAPARSPAWAATQRSDQPLHTRPESLSFPVHLRLHHWAAQLSEEPFYSWSGLLSSSMLKSTQGVVCWAAGSTTTVSIAACWELTSTAHGHVGVPRVVENWRKGHGSWNWLSRPGIEKGILILC